MRLQKQLSRKYGGKEYPKFVVAIPPKQVEQAGWIEGIELEAKVEGNTIIIRPKEIY